MNTVNKFSIMFILLFVFTSSVSVSASPLDLKKSDRIKGEYSYSSPEFFHIGFKNTEYIGFNPGYLWKRNFYFSTLNTEVMGDNFMPYAWDAQPYVHTSYVGIINLGYMKDFNFIRLFGGIGAGVFSVDRIKINPELYSQTASDTSLGLNLDLGFKFTLSYFFFEFILKSGFSENHYIGSGYLESGINAGKNWKLGLISSYADRSINSCNSDDECTYDFSLHYGVIYVGRRLGKYWILLGLVVENTLKLDMNGTINELNPDFTSIYISLRQ